jgi:hypothetical protein
MVSQVITYPFCVVKVNSKKKKLLLNKNATISSGIYLCLIQIRMEL